MLPQRCTFTRQRLSLSLSLVCPPSPPTVSPVSISLSSSCLSRQRLPFPCLSLVFSPSPPALSLSSVPLSPASLSLVYPLSPSLPLLRQSLLLASIPRLQDSDDVPALPLLFLRCSALVSLSRCDAPSLYRKLVPVAAVLLSLHFPLFGAAGSLCSSASIQFLQGLLVVVTANASFFLRFHLLLLLPPLLKFLSFGLENWFSSSSLLALKRARRGETI